MLSSIETGKNFFTLSFFSLILVVFFLVSKSRLVVSVRGILFFLPPRY